MDNIKKFEDFLDRMQGLLDNAKKQGHIIVRIEDLENTFPELAESEDERIRKAIISLIQNGGYMSKEEKAKAFAWLEKQGEPNPYSGVSFEYNGHIWGMCARDYGVDISLDKKLFKHLEKQGEQVIDANKMIEQEWSEKDEKVRKSIIELVEWVKEQQIHTDHNTDGTKWDDMIAWLEKQESVGEIVERCKNSWYNEGKIAGMAEGLTDDEKYQQGWHDALCTTASTTIEPKFHEGDIVIKNTGFIGQILKVGDNEYILTNTGFIPFKYEHLWSRWTIKNAKSGDVIYIKRYKDNSEWLLTFKKIESQNNYIDVYDYYAFSITRGNVYHDFIGCWGLLLDGDIVCPATKEQREILFQKMKEAGYEWDTEKKEVKKIELEPQLKEGNFYKCIKSYHHLCGNEYWFDKGKVYFCEKDGYLRSDHNNLINVYDCKNWQSYFRIHTGKPAWREEDERIHQCLIRDQEKALDDVRNDKYGHSEIIQT